MAAARATANSSRRSARISPCKKDENFKLNLDRAKYWVSKGAQPSDTVASFIKKATQGRRAARRTAVA